MTFLLCDPDCNELDVQKEWEVITHTHILNEVVERKILTRLDLLSIPQSGEKMSKSLGGIIGYK